MHDGPAEVLSNEDLGSGVWLLTLRAPEVAAAARPGSFVMIATAPGLVPLLPRPFSIQRAAGERIELLYRVVGEGTACMTAMNPGDGPRVLGPLGNTFTLPAPGETAVLLGGGVGIPPMVALADALLARDGEHARFEAYLGVSGAADAGCWVGFDRGPSGLEGRVVRATMDGSIGFAGHVVGAWLDRWETRRRAPSGPARLYACGPMVMLRAVAAAAAERGLPCEVSVETMMGCGVGVCMGCVIENKRYAGSGSKNPYDRWLLACRKGPVFDAEAVILDDGGLLH